MCAVVIIYFFISSYFNYRDDFTEFLMLGLLLSLYVTYDTFIINTAIIAVKDYFPLSYRERMAPYFIKNDNEKEKKGLLSILFSSAYLLVTAAVVVLPLCYTWGMIILYRNSNNVVKSIIVLFIHPLFTELIAALMKGTLVGW